MGKRARKTRWRALDIADDHSDSEESNTNSSVVSSRYSRSNSNGYYSKYSYSSQSTPARRRYNQYDGSSKSTRSSSTTSENKITFNEDEYTRITTPRQDVLFKKGYLNKPRNYQTQTSTGNSTISTGDSTENGTPDHQSTDLDYESQFVFPNGFVDQNGIYYVNSYESYPLMLFNPPTYYHEFSNVKSKRYSTGSLSESMSPNNEEVTSQDLIQSGGEASNSGVSDYSGGPPVFNMVYPGYYVNGTCTPTDLANDQDNLAEPVKKLKKRRERKSSKTIPGDSSEYSDENSSDEPTEDSCLCIPEQCPQEAGSTVEVSTTLKSNGSLTEALQSNLPNTDETHKTASYNSTNSHDQSLPNGCADEKTEPTDKTLETDRGQLKPDSQKPSVLKPDAEEFVPRAYQTLGPPPHIKMIPPNFMPIPLVPISDFGAQNFAPHPAFIPPGIPINFIPHHLGQKIFPPPAPGFVTFTPPVVPEARIEEKGDPGEDKVSNSDKERDNIATPSHTPVLEGNKQVHSKIIDIATVVSKLEAVKEQEKQQDTIASAKPVINDSKPFRNTCRSTNSQNINRRHYYNKYRNSPVLSGDATVAILNGYSSPKAQNSPHHFRQSPANNGDVIQHVQPRNGVSKNINYRNSPVRHNTETKRIEVPQKPLVNGVEDLTTHTSTSNCSKQTQSSPEKFQKRSWKPNGYPNTTYKNSNYGSPKRTINCHQANQKPVVNNNRNFHGSTKSVQGAPHQTVEQKLTPLLSSNSSPQIVEPKSEQVKPKPNNQWISVSSRKKKRHKAFEEELDTDANDDNNSSDLYEIYDPSQLVDVVRLSQAVAEENKIEDILTSIAQTETTEILIDSLSSPNIPEVSHIEKNIMNKIEEEHQVVSEQRFEANETASTKVDGDDVKEERVNPSEPTDNVKEEKEEELKSRKRSKKAPQKSLMKKVIITDIFNDLSISSLRTKPSSEKSAKNVQEIKPVINREPSPAKQPSCEVEKELSEKKPKKKKKNKNTKSTSDNNKPVSNESFELLLESSLACEGLEKTNDEISQELDKLIQRGMYSSLHEKMKSINVEPGVDDFFKTFGSVLTPVKDNQSAAALKTPDFNRIFQSTRQFLKPNMVSVEHDNTDSKVDVDNKDTKSTSSTTDAANPSAGLVLGVASAVHDDPETPVEQEIQDKKLYPITQAVKEWMSKTREATPEIEILKSPLAIHQEFGSLDDLEDDEITIFSSEDTLIEEQQPDLLECWENELPVVQKDCDLLKDTWKICADGKSCDKCRTDCIKQGEEEIEVYESKYGQNEAFLHLQREMRKRQSETPPRPGHLPVCCSLQ